MKQRIKWKNVIIALIILICLITLLISIIKIIKWHKDNKNTEEIIEKIEEIVEVEEIDPEGDPEEVLPNLYYDYMNVSLINVDFNELNSINSDTAGWIKVNGTKVNYPFVHTNDNEYYLTHSFDKTWNDAGWIFMDYRNNKDLSNKNTILYGHGRLDRTMFGSMRDIVANGWLNDPSNFVIKISTQYENTLWQVFSVYRIPTTNDYLRVNFSSDDDFINFTKMLINRSAYNFNTEVSKDDQMLTLSTCHGKLDKVVIHAKLIKKEAR